MKKAEIEAQITEHKTEDGLVDYNNEFLRLLKIIAENTKKE